MENLFNITKKSIAGTFIDFIPFCIILFSAEKLISSTKTISSSDLLVNTLIPIVVILCIMIKGVKMSSSIRQISTLDNLVKYRLEKLSRKMKENRNLSIMFYPQYGQKNKEEISQMQKDAEALGISYTKYNKIREKLTNAKIYRNLLSVEIKSGRENSYDEIDNVLTLEKSLYHSLYKTEKFSEIIFIMMKNATSNMQSEKIDAYLKGISKTVAKSLIDQK